ncbi:anti-sigma factor family protein [Rubrobacter aplysinae]|uniref:anti-sigma factor family protein n=1 Tax=Rubrobacter aplysinae TaxID=909625 RepID=UPI00064BA425|nr:zf-HC2 domain-containing protein [Rubrobacter aplysinae]
MTDNYHRYYKELLGAYALGHLEGEEERELQSHLAHCESCRKEAEELGQVAATLVQDRDSAHPEVEHTLDQTPPPALEDRVVAVATGKRAGENDHPRHRHHGRRRRLSAPSLIAASVAVVLLAVAGIWAIPTAPEEPGLGDVEPISFTTEPQGISADGEVVAHTWGTEVILEMEGLEEDERYTVEVLGEDGTRASAGTLIGDAEQPVECNLNGAVLRENAEAVSVRDSGGALVLRSDLDGP